MGSTFKNNLIFFPDQTFIIPEKQLGKNIKHHFINTEDNKKIELLHFKSIQATQQLVIYFHGNAGNLYQRIDGMTRISQMQTDVILLGYRGYGLSEGKASEKGINLDGKAVIDFALNKLGYLESNITIIGRSIGSTVAVKVSQNRQFKQLILISPLTSATQMAAEKMPIMQWFVKGELDNLSSLQNVDIPLIIIHGSEDKVIPFAMGQKLFDSYKGEKNLISIQEAGHNNLQQYSEYWFALDKWISGATTN